MLGVKGGLDCKNPEVVQYLYKKMGRAAVIKARSIVHDQQVATEIVQEVFLKAWKKSPSFENEKAAYAWIYVTTQRAAIDHIRLASSRHESSGVEMEAVYSDNASQLDEASSRQLVQSCLKFLTEEEANIFIYQNLDHMTQEEIAALMGVSRKTVQRTLGRIHEKIETFKSKHHD